MRPVQLFTDEYLQRCRQATPEAILEFLESFRLMTDTSGKSKLISIKIPRSLLESFRRKCELEQIRYQTQIKNGMANLRARVLEPGGREFDSLRARQYLHPVAIGLDWSGVEHYRNEKARDQRALESSTHAAATVA
jgi:hypothetical protein